MEKGTRVRIVRGGKGEGETGTVFWTGPNKWGEGERLGVRTDSGDTWWVSDQDVEADDKPAPALEAGPTFAKGDRVSFRTQGRDGTGEVFWIGESRNGPGQRIGVRDDSIEGSDNAVWLESRQAQALEGSPSPGPTPRAAPAGMPAAHEDGYDDALIDQMAQEDDEE